MGKALYSHCWGALSIGDPCARRTKIPNSTIVVNKELYVAPILLLLLLILLLILWCMFPGAILTLDSSTECPLQWNFWSGEFQNVPCVQQCQPNDKPMWQLKLSAIVNSKASPCWRVIPGSFYRQSAGDVISVFKTFGSRIKE